MPKVSAGRRFGKRRRLIVPPAHLAQWAGLSPQKHPSFLGISRVQLQLSDEPPIPARARRRHWPHSWPTPSLPCRLAGRRKASTATSLDTCCPRRHDRSGGGPKTTPSPRHRVARSATRRGEPSHCRKFYCARSCVRLSTTSHKPFLEAPVRA